MTIAIFIVAGLVANLAVSVGLLVAGFRMYNQLVAVHTSVSTIEITILGLKYAANDTDWPNTDDEPTAPL